jgi:signal peptidase I
VKADLPDPDDLRSLGEAGLPGYPTGPAPGEDGLPVPAFPPILPPPILPAATIVEGKSKSKKDRNGLVEALFLVLIALVLALTLKTYVAEAYEIKGRSMFPTFENGQRVVVLKAFYDIEREDIVVFTSKEDRAKDLIKRVVGLPGETVRIIAGQVYINGVELPEAYARHTDRDRNERPLERRIPPGHYYVLGDNRPDSHDSRSFEEIPAVNIKGKVLFRWWPFGEFKSF